jgi:hypothetical protein
MKVQDIESAIEQLSPEELKQFSAWFDEYVADQWDQQIERGNANCEEYAWMKERCAVMLA